MIKIFIESGVNQAQRKNKRTTNEQDFVEKFIQRHFPHYRPSIDFPSTQRTIGLFQTLCEMYQKTEQEENKI